MRELRHGALGSGEAEPSLLRRLLQARGLLQAPPSAGRVRARAGRADRGGLEARRGVERATDETRPVGLVAAEAGRGNWRAASWLLERRYPERWAPIRRRPDGELEVEVEIDADDPVRRGRRASTKARAPTITKLIAKVEWALTWLVIGVIATVFCALTQAWWLALFGVFVVLLSVAALVEALRSRDRVTTPE